MFKVKINNIKKKYRQDYEGNVWKSPITIKLFNIMFQIVLSCKFRNYKSY